ncbi:unnamed protein product, partial [Soboliphyme baturini]|uniref:MYND-type domain-containing protein n=1 Tax=Soboliphyme baturini TaxID=241478 RepID=A0A183J976_9BILA
CSGCHWFRYCDKSCQRAGWCDHKLECERLRQSFPHLPLTDVLFLGRVIDKLNFMQQHGHTRQYQAQREFADLMSHEDEVRADDAKMNQFDAMYDKAQRFLTCHMPSKEQFFTIFCKTCINSHTIHSNSGAEIGMALDLGK